MDEPAKVMHTVDVQNETYDRKFKLEATVPELKQKAREGGAVKKKKSSISKTKSETITVVDKSPDPKSVKHRGRKKVFEMLELTTTDPAFEIAGLSEKQTKTLRKFSTSEASDLCSDFSAKMNSSDNMRKIKQNRRIFVPSNSSELKDVNPLPLNSALSETRSPDIDKKQNKFRSKTPDYKGVNKPAVKKVGSSKSPKFEPYIPLFQVQQGLKRGEFIEGALRINPRNYEDAYVNAPDGKMDIYIGGMKDRNRALNGDIVVVQINPKQEWKVLCDAIKDYQEKCADSVFEAVCEPITPSTPCKVHTPDKFVKYRPLSANSWDSTCGKRLPDTLEILGVDKLTQQLEDISVGKNEFSKSKSKVKSKCKKHFKGSSSQKSSTTSYSQESSEDCLDDVLPVQQCNSEDGGQCVSFTKENGHLNILTEHDKGITSDGRSVATEKMSYTPYNMSEIGAFKLEMKSYQDATESWQSNETSVNIIVSPEELLNIDGHSIVEHENLFYKDERNCDSSSSIDGIVVAPGDLSGDEFTDSASIGSTPSEHLDQMLEDAAFLACQQDAVNNNADFSYHNESLLTQYNSSDFTGFVAVPNATIHKETSIEYECRLQYNKTIPPLSSVEVNSESVICSALSKISFPDEPVSSEETVIMYPSSVNDYHLTAKLKNVDQPCIAQCNKKKSKNRKKKKKITKTTETLNDNIQQTKINFDMQNLTVEEVMKHPEWERFIQKTGKVVHILERKHSCLAAGRLKLCPDKNPKWALFSPNDSRVPRIMVPMSDCPQNFYHRPFDYANVLFLAKISEWNDSSTFARGTLVRSLGNTGDIEVETEGILFENDIDCEDFPLEVLNILPEEETWEIPAKEIKYRQDFRHECVFTIDPATARDMDDAVSCTLLDNGNYKVGVHIADVTYFVKEGSILDDVARSRSTSVYLVQKVVPMLPRRLCDDLCSLNPGKDRLTFSVIWELSPDGEILNECFSRSIINSCIKLSYEHAQDMIENPTRIWDAQQHPRIYGGFTICDIIKRVNELHSLAVKLREKRFHEGALRLDQVKLQFTLDSETGLPSGFNVFVQKDSNKLIEEFMLLANMSVATKIYNTFPSIALLRRHPPPQLKPMQDIVSMCRAMGVYLDASSSGALQSSIAYHAGDDFFSRSKCLLLQSLCSKPMNCALYFCSGFLSDPAKFHHYALNVPLYTHFTSPIRRYPDIIVHRLLGAALLYNSTPDVTAEVLQRCAVHCNDKKYNAKRVSELSSELFLAAFIRELASVPAKAMVMGVMDHSFDCLILEMGIIKRVYCDKLPLLRKEYKRSNGIPTLNLYWKDAVRTSGFMQTIVMFTVVDVVLTVEKDSLQIRATLQMPTYV
ncbi:DIS3-like exonuclease 2 [Stegodyphus dumicola]|uniref:DIS3-like exonuclease 2 n=1 Tax=Stegodyphus dumicola TaxID=202533 RepID=UPI0015A9DA2D|nr:DIS3-like exonuclease 2 [Stegodyphus dumicola]